MKGLLFLLIFIFVSNRLFAQPENYKIAMGNFQTNYNQEKYDEIFNSFSVDMKRYLPVDSATQFLSELKTQFGTIESTTFTGMQQGTYATYKTRFEKAVLAINISFDDRSNINGLSIAPYEGTEERKTVNALSSYPRAIAEAIFLRSQYFPNNTQLSIAMIQNGKTSYYGIIKQNDTIQPIDNKSRVFEIGSITKVFTSTVLAALVEDKKLKLTDNVNRYYPFAFKDNIKLSFENLANHTSGLPRLPGNMDLSDDMNPYKNYGKDQLGNYLKNHLQLENDTLKSYSYSNLGAGLLGYTLGLSQKMSFQQLLQKTVFDKYKMDHSFTSPENAGNKLVKGQDPDGKVVPNWDFDVLFGGGGILSTTEDLAKFATAQFDTANKALALTRKPTFDIDKNMKIGLGWHILKSEKGKDIVWHNGGTGGYASSMGVMADDKAAVIILSNVSAFNPKMEHIDELCMELLDGMEKQ